MKSSMRLFEKYRPSVLSDVVGQDKAVAVVRRIIDQGAGGRAVWLSGTSGSGKTTLARIIAHSIADPFFVEECVADELGVERLDGWIRSMRLCAWGKGGRAFIVNEAHGLRAVIQRRLDGLLEEDLPGHCVVIFTTTWDGQEAMFDGIDAGPLLSRCTPIRLTNQGLAQAFAERALTIARTENLDGQPIAAYVKLAKRCNNNMRAMLQEIDAGCMIE